MKLTRENIKEAVYSSITNIITACDYTLDPTYGTDFFIYKRQHPWGYDYMALPNIRFSTEGFSFRLNISRRYHFIEKMWEDLAHLIDVRFSTAQAIQTISIDHRFTEQKDTKKTYLERHGMIEFPFTPGILDNAKESIGKILNDTILPALEEFRNIITLDNRINGTYMYDEIVHRILVTEGVMFRRIIISKLAGAANFEELCTFYRSLFSWYEEKAKVPGSEYFGNYPMVFEKVYDRLKGIPPLSNTF